MDIGNLGSVYENAYSSSANQSAKKLENQLEADYSKATDDEIMDVCKEFEAYFVEQMFKEMWKTVPKSEESTGSISTLKEYYQEQMIQEYAATSTEQNGLGIAQALYEQMKCNYGLE